MTIGDLIKAYEAKEITDSTLIDLVYHDIPKVFTYTFKSYFSMFNVFGMLQGQEDCYFRIHEEEIVND